MGSTNIFSFLLVLPWWIWGAMVCFDMVVAYIVWRLTFDNAKFWPQLRFRIIFGTWPRPAWSHYDQHQIIQTLVDRNLSLKAWQFLGACSEEEQIKKKYGPGSSNYETERRPLRDLRALQRVTNKVLRLKRCFWYAHGIAKDRGHTVRDSAHDYKN